jgi:hypothetical protein
LFSGCLDPTSTAVELHAQICYGSSWSKNLPIDSCRDRCTARLVSGLANTVCVIGSALLTTTWPPIRVARNESAAFTA